MTKKKTPAATYSTVATKAYSDTRVLPWGDFAERPENLREMIETLRENLCAILLEGVNYRLEDFIERKAGDYIVVTVRAVPEPS